MMENRDQKTMTLDLHSSHNYWNPDQPREDRILIYLILLQKHLISLNLVDKKFYIQSFLHETIHHLLRRHFQPLNCIQKIKQGATFVQLITGMIYEGPQLTADINLRLPELLKKDGYAHISKAVGTKSR